MAGRPAGFCASTVSPCLRLGEAQVGWPRRTEGRGEGDVRGSGLGQGMRKRIEAAAPLVTLSGHSVDLPGVPRPIEQDRASCWCTRVCGL